MGRGGTICRTHNMEVPCHRKHQNQMLFRCPSWQGNCQSFHWSDPEGSINRMYATEALLAKKEMNEKSLLEELEEKKKTIRKLKEEKAALMEGMKKMERDFQLIKIRDTNHWIVTVLIALGILLLSMKFGPVD